jgi:Mn2+/Fe2+ NRAMP family transporter
LERCGDGLGTVIQERFGRKILVASIFVLVVANTATIGADLGGVAAGIHLLIPVPRLLAIPAVGLLLITVEVFWSYRSFSGALKWLTVVLLLYIGSGLVAHPNWSRVAAGSLIPHLSFSSTFLSAVVAVLGTTISPYMFFWIDSEEVEEREISEGPDPHEVPGGAKKAERERRTDIVAGMGVARS